jgi:nucleotidyltransferase substrate binding protein (TIGR01987 family)
MAVATFQQKYEQFFSALELLQEVLKNDNLIANEPIVARAAIIQFFEIASEACWKMLKTYLWEEEEIDVASPKKVFRECRNIQILDEEQTILALKMIGDRNMTAHVYGEEVIEDIYKRIPQYAVLMQEIAQALVIKS